ncbi:hypothetical protein OAP18_03280 [Gammaproteobacteria bacterium]|nr:hypothetical protein [Gammaproteobacteria bacterium]
MVTALAPAKNSTIDSEECLCLIIQIDPVQIIVPRVLVAEVIHYDESNIKPETTGKNLSTLSWRGFEVPLIKQSLINPGCTDEYSPLSKVLVFYGLLNTAKIPYFALVASRNPRLMSVLSTSILEDKQVKKLNSGELQAVQVNEESAVIPKVDYLEKYILDNYFQK